MSKDLISNTISAINNGQKVFHQYVIVRYSKIVEEILKVLVEQGFVEKYQVLEDENKNYHKTIKVFLLYYEGKPVISKLYRVSKSSRRVYKGVKNMLSICNGLGISIVSTSKGVMTGYECQEQNIGGEVICAVY